MLGTEAGTGGCKVTRVPVPKVILSVDSSTQEQKKSWGREAGLQGREPGDSVFPNQQTDFDLTGWAFSYLFLPESRGGRQFPSS